MKSAVATVVLVGSCCLPAAGQAWSSTTYSGAPVYSDGFQVVHSNGADMVAFSAQTQRFTVIGLAGDTMIGVGDWCTLLKHGNTGYVGYSARTDRIAGLPLNIEQVYLADVDDDVALVIALETNGKLAAHGYSAQTNAWQTVELCGIPDLVNNVVLSRFVIGVLEEGCGLLHGFSARTGSWQTIAAGGTVNATGNVLTCKDGATVHAFTGVLGIWTSSPSISDDVLAQSHNLAYVRATVSPSNDWQPCVYSAYDGLWVSSPTVHSSAPLVESLTENVMYVEKDAAGERLAEAIGTRPHQKWASLLCPGAATSIELGQQADWSVAQFDDQLIGFSGLCEGEFSATAFTGTAELKPAQAHHALVGHVGTPEWLAFSPLRNQWSVTTLVGASSPPGGGAISVLRNDTHRIAYSARWNEWTAGPSFSGTLTPVTGSSVHAGHDTGGDEVFVFNERRRDGQWEGPFTFNAGFTMAAERNLAVFVEPVAGGNTRVWGYSPQRGDLRSSGGVPGALADGPHVEENVAWFVGNDGLLYAYGTTNQIHYWYDHPNGSEFTVPDPYPVGLPDTFAKHVIYDRGGNSSLLWKASGWLRLHGLPVPGGTLWLGTPSPGLAPSPYGPVPADGILEIEQHIPSVVPPCTTLWVQPVILPPIGPARLTSRADPLRIQ